MKLSERLKKRELRVILDTSAYTAALISPNGVSAAVFEQIIEQKAFNFYTDEIIAEIKDVLARDKFKIEKEKQEYFIHLIKEASFKIEQFNKFKIKKCRDPKDDKFLSLANQIEADFIISWDEDLLVLKNIGKPKIIKPDEFLRILRSR